jgi:PleD family two-component response regulator
VKRLAGAQAPCVTSAVQCGGEALIRRVDLALYRAQQIGRDRIETLSVPAWR